MRSHLILEQGNFVNPIIAPGVPIGSERLRCFVIAAHCEADLHAAEAIGDVVRPVARLPGE